MGTNSHYDQTKKPQNFIHFESKCIFCLLQYLLFGSTGKEMGISKIKNKLFQLYEIWLLIKATSNNQLKKNPIKNKLDLVNLLS